MEAIDQPKTRRGTRPSKNPMHHRAYPLMKAAQNAARSPHPAPPATNTPNQIVSSRSSSARAIAESLIEIVFSADILSRASRTVFTKRALISPGLCRGEGQAHKMLLDGKFESERRAVGARRMRSVDDASEVLQWKAEIPPTSPRQLPEAGPSPWVMARRGSHSQLKARVSQRLQGQRVERFQWDSARKGSGSGCEAKGSENCWA